MSLSPDQRLEIANEHYARAEYDLALPQFERLVCEGLRYPDVFNKLGVIHHLAGRLTEARQCFEKALEENGAYLEAALNLTVTCNELGQYGTGVRTMARAQKTAESTDDAYRRGKVANFHRAMSHAYLELERPEDALHELGRALRLCPTFHDIRLDLARLLKTRGNTQRAREELMLILQLQPNHHDARALLGVLEIETGDARTGIGYLRAVLAQCANHPVAAAYLQQAEAKFRQAS